MTNTWPVTDADRADPVEQAIAQRLSEDGTLGADEQMSCYMVVGRTHRLSGNGSAAEFCTWAASEGTDIHDQIQLLEETAAILRRRLIESN